MKFIKYIMLFFIVSIFGSCKKYLDIIPDNIATLDYAFRTRFQAEKYLFTCYSYLPRFDRVYFDPWYITGDETLLAYPGYSSIATGVQNVVDPYSNMWSNGDESLFKAINTCNTFLEQVKKVPDLQNYEMVRWVAEVKFLKAYYHFYLLRMYGPIPIMDINLPVSVSPEDAQVKRQPVDSCFKYIVNLIDEASEGLPKIIQKGGTELGRITQPIALSIKARILTTAASSLFNGNPDYAGFKDKQGMQLFNPTYDPQKWVIAAKACKDAIDLCTSSGLKIYHFNPQVNIYNLSPEMQIEMDIRNAMTEKWNSEIIWGDPNARTQEYQERSIVSYNVATLYENSFFRSGINVPLNMAKMFYSKNGVPISEDKTLDFTNPEALRTATEAEKYKIEPGYVTARLNFDREPRFYADLGFDGGKLYGAGNYEQDNAWHLEARRGGYSSYDPDGSKNSITGYYPKKPISFLSYMDQGSYMEIYPWPVMRLSDLYLLYAEALNEANGPSAEVYKWVNIIRTRAGIPDIETSWNQYSFYPQKYANKDGLREIIHKERLIEFAFEGRQYWDLTRWKEAEKVLNEPIEGWDTDQADPQFYYRTIIRYPQKFKKRDYFWPIKEFDLIVNKNLVQSPGW